MRETSLFFWSRPSRIFAVIVAGFLLNQASWAADPSQPRARPTGPPDFSGAPAKLSPPEPDPYWTCGSPIDDLLVGSGVDLGQRGFDLRRLGDGYALRAFTARGDCTAAGEPDGTDLAADTQWERSTGEPILVTQSVTTFPGTNVVEWGQATFSAGDYRFQVSLSGWWWDGSGAPISADATPSTAGGPPPAASKGTAAVPFGPRPPAAPTFARPETKRFAADPLPDRIPPRRVMAKAKDDDILNEAITRLAPEIDLACFYRRTAGTWDDLAHLGIGDPRPAVPERLSEEYLDLSYLQFPAAGCDVPLPAYGEGTGFYAYFNSPEGDWAAVSVYSLYPGTPPGSSYIDDYRAYWSDARFSYSVSVSSAYGVGDRDLVEALILAIDPDFSLECLAQGRLLTPRQVLALGFHLARAPLGYSEIGSNLYAQTASPECATPPPAYYSFNWSFTNGFDIFIDASQYFFEGAPAGDGTVYYVPGYLSWTDTRGIIYSVYGYSYNGGDPPRLRRLEAVARSMDPAYAGVNP